MINVAIADDHDLFRDGVRMILSEEKDIEVIGSFKNGAELISFLQNKRPDIILLDISMPVMDGFDATKKALQKYPDIKILVLSMFDDEEHYHKMIDLGVKGFILKKSGSFEMIKAIKEIYEGGNYFSQELLQKVIVSFNKKNEVEIELTDREQEVLILICNGHTNNEIGESLFISPKTADNHRTALLKKTKTRNSAHLVMFAMKNKLIEI